MTYHRITLFLFGLGAGVAFASAMAGAPWYIWGVNAVGALLIGAVAWRTR